MNTHLPAPRTGASRAVLALALAGSLSVAHAAASTDIPETELPPVTVSAHGDLAVPYDQTGVSVTVLDLTELKEQGISSLTEAMTSVPGVFVIPGGGLNQRGNVSNIAIRGMHKGNMCLPMMDGMRLYSFSNSLNMTPNILGHTNLFGLGTVEVLRGSQGAVYGSGAMGGVIYMETPEGQGEPSLTLFNEVGSFDSYTGNAVAQGQTDQLSYYVSACYEHTNNDVRYMDGRNVTFRHAGRYAAWNEALRLDYRINDDNKLTLTFRREDADMTAAPADYGFMWGRSDYKYRTNLLTARLQTRLNERWTSSLMAGYMGSDYMLTSGYNLDQRNVQIEWRNAYKWNEQHTTTAGFAWNREDFSCKSYSMDDSLNNVYALFAEHSYSPAKNWDNSLALRWDQSSIYDGFVTLRAATNYRFNHERTRAFASVGNGYISPSSLQRGGEYRSGVQLYRGNSQLDCTSSINADLGLEQEIAPNHYASGTFFWLREEDAVVEDNSQQPDYISWENDSAHWTIQGIELALHGTWEKHWNTGYRLEWTYVQPKSSDDKQLTETARQMWSADVHTSPLEGLTTGIGMTAAVGRRDYAGYRLDNYCVFRWYARYQVNEQLALHLRVENLTNEKFIADSTGNPMDYSTWPPSGPMGFGGSLLNSGAAVYAGCTVTF